MDFQSSCDQGPPASIPNPHRAKRVRLLPPVSRNDIRNGRGPRVDSRRKITSRISWSGKIPAKRSLDGASCALDPFRMVCGPRGFHADELLGRTATGAGSGKFRKVAASGRICLPEVQDSAAFGSPVEVRAMRSTVRHIPNSGHLSALWGPVPLDPVFGLRRHASVERMDCCRLRTYECVACVHGNVVNGSG